MAGAFDRTAILESFLKEVASYLPEIDAHLDRLQKHSGDTEALEEIYRRAHTIAGAAAMMEIPTMARIANAMQQVMETVLDGAPLSPQTSTALRHSTGRLRQLIELVRTGKDDSSLVAQDAAEYATLRQSTSDSRVVPTAPSEPRVMPSPPSSPPAAPVRPVAPPMPAPPNTANPYVQSQWPQPPAWPEPSASPMRGPSGNAHVSPVELPTGPVPIVTPGMLAAGGVSNDVRLAESTLWQDVQGEENTLRSVATALLASITRLREVGGHFDQESSEMGRFLDGSPDALDRLEQWAGQAMGIDLRTSPDHVRRYLPLSVLWVVKERLKQIVTLLHDTTRGFVVQNEALTESLGHLHDALEQVGDLRGSVAVAASALPDGGFATTVTSTSYVPSPLPAPRVASGTPTGTPRLPDHAEIERQVREALRRELEDEVRAEIALEVRRDEERRLRQELEIQLRRQLLAEIAPALASTSGMDARTPLSPPRDATARPRSVQVTPERYPEAVEIFRTEAEEHLRTIAAGVDQLQVVPDDAEALQRVRRAFHTLKGAAAITGFTAVADLAHISEDVLDGISQGTITASPDVVNLILDTCQGLEAMVEDDTAEQGGEFGILAALRPRYEAILGNTLPIGATPAPQPAVRPITTAHFEEDGEEETEGEATPPRQSPTGIDVGDLNVRLNLRKLDELIMLFGDVLVNRSVVEERMGRISQFIRENGGVGERLREIGSKIDRQFEAALLPSQRQLQGPGMAAGGPAGGGYVPRTMPPTFGGVMSGPHASPGQTGDFDPLELDRYGDFHQLSRGLNEAITDASGLNAEMEAAIHEMEVAMARESRLSSLFQDALLKVRLVPIKLLTPRIYRAIQSVAVKYNKEFELFVEGEDTEVDRSVYEDIAAPLLHLARNAIYHGIESPATRAAAGKPPKGRIVLSARYEGSQILVAMRDDGAGLNIEHIRATALARGMIDAYSQISNAELLNVIFQPGFSTSEMVTEEGGRGVGLDVVRDTVTRLRGTIEVDSTISRGTTFTLKIPISLQIQRVVLVRVGEQSYAIPMGAVEQLGQLDFYGRSNSTDRPALEVRGEQYPLVHLATYLHLTPGPVHDKTPVLLLHTGQRRWGLLIDAIIGRQEIVAKNLGPHLRDIPGISGATVLGNGQVMLILDPLALLSYPPRTDQSTIAIPPPGTTLQRPGSEPLGMTLAPPRDTVGNIPRPARPMSTLAPDARNKPYLLVVDDSPSVRRVVSATLKDAGWDVLTARDGIEALEMVAKQTPAAILLDIEMPRMDGYELMAAIRAQPTFRQLPLIVLTSRAASKHQQRALQLGADAYVVKPYQDERLLATVQELVHVRPDGTPR